MILFFFSSVFLSQKMLKDLLFFDKYLLATEMAKSEENTAAFADIDTTWIQVICYSLSVFFKNFALAGEFRNNKGCLQKLAALPFN